MLFEDDEYFNFFVALSMIQLGSKGETSIEINKLFEVAEASEKLRTKSTLGETYEVIASMVRYFPQNYQKFNFCLISFSHQQMFH